MRIGYKNESHPAKNKFSHILLIVNEFSIKKINIRPKSSKPFLC